MSVDSHLNLIWLIFEFSDFPLSKNVLLWESRTSIFENRKGKNHHFPRYHGQIICIISLIKWEKFPVVMILIFLLPFFDTNFAKQIVLFCEENFDTSRLGIVSWNLSLTTPKCWWFEMCYLKCVISIVLFEMCYLNLVV